MGAEVVCGTDDRKDAALFSENHGRAIVSCRTEYAMAELTAIAGKHGCPCALLGWVKGDRLQIGFHPQHIAVDLPVIDLWNVWENAIPKAVAGE